MNCPLFWQPWSYVLSLIEIGSMVLKKSFKYMLFRHHLPLKKSVNHHLNKLEFLLLKDALWQKKLIEISPVVLEKKIFKISSTYFYLPMEKGVSLLWTNHPRPRPKFGETDSVVLEKKITMWKDNRRTDGRRKKGDQKISLELSAQVS